MTKKISLLKINLRKAAFILMFLPPLSIGYGSENNSGNMGAVINNENSSRRLYVYKDFVDSVNNFTQKMWMGDSFENIIPMNEKAVGFSGTSGIAAELDLSRHVWGGYMFITGSLIPGPAAALNNPENSKTGLDLTGAEKLVFYARGDIGSERVEFFMGGLGWDGRLYPDSAKQSMGYVALTNEWKRFEIPLDGIDLSHIGCGFGWVANNTNNPDKNRIKFYIDDIYYEFSPANPVNANKPDPSRGNSASVRFGTEIYVVHIGTIGKNEAGNTSVELLSNQFDAPIFTRNGKATPPVGMKIIANGQTFEFQSADMSDVRHIFHFDSTAAPEKIIVYGNDGSDGSSAVFDAKTRQLDTVPSAASKTSDLSD